MNPLAAKATSLAELKTELKAQQEQHDLQLWLQAEKSLIQGFSPEHLRTSGLLSVKRQRWQPALLRLEQAVSSGVCDLQTLDALGEAAYQAKMPQALLAHAQYYRQPKVATHMVRAFLLLSEFKAAEEYLALAENSLLKAGLTALLGVKENIKTSREAMFLPLSVSAELNFAELNFSEYWQALSVVADAAKNNAVTQLAELRSKAIDYANPRIHYNQALRLLAKGEFRAGWKLYEWRLVPGSQCAQPTRLVDIPMWEGEDLGEVASENKSLLLVLEFGFGDQIFALRYAQELIRVLGFTAGLHIAVGKELWALVKESFPQATRHPLESLWHTRYWQTQSASPPVDYWCYSFSVPARFGCTNPVQTAGYLKAPENLVKACQQQIQKMNPQKLPVKALVWHGDMANAAMRTRAYEVSEFLKQTEVLKTPSVIVCLQKDVTADELQILKSLVSQAGGVLFNAASELIDFAITSAWIKAVDHVYSCDTAVAHLAGALAAPTTVMIRNKSIWHWRKENRAENNKAVWYDSVQVKYALELENSYMFDMRTEAPEAPSVHAGAREKTW